METQSLVLINTGDGKGKSSAAFGVMARAWARGWRVCVIQFIKNDVATICLGQAASAAAVLLAAGTKGKRLALPHSRILLHQPYGQVGYGQVTDLELAAKEILRMRDLLEEILARHTGQSRERVHADTDRDFVMEASEALAYGIIDDVISSRQMVDRTGPIR